MGGTCEFGTLRNSLIKDRIVLGVSNCKTRERLLRVQELTFEKAFDMVRLAEMTEKQLQELESDSLVHGIGKEKSKSVLKKQHSEKNHLQTRLLIAEIAEQDMMQENAPRMEKLATIARDRIISKICAGHERKFMGLKKKPKNTTATQTCLLEPSPPRLNYKMMNVLRCCQRKDMLHDLS